jgi:hypothetical protein
MNPVINKEGVELEIHIEELEQKIAPDGGETVLPLTGPPTTSGPPSTARP